ncbi:MAG: hypothetical protein CMO05_06860 [Thalassospira sp.]|nr:hypothetical protein [Thalassospira sp.]
MVIAKSIIARTYKFSCDLHYGLSRSLEIVPSATVTCRQPLQLNRDTGFVLFFFGTCLNEIFPQATPSQYKQGYNGCEFPMHDLFSFL